MAAAKSPKEKGLEIDGSIITLTWQISTRQLVSLEIFTGSGFHFKPTLFLRLIPNPNRYWKCFQTLVCSRTASCILVETLFQLKIGAVLVIRQFATPVQERIQYILRSSNSNYWQRACPVRSSGIATGAAVTTLSSKNPSSDEPQLCVVLGPSGVSPFCAREKRLKGESIGKKEMLPNRGKGR